MDLDTIIIFGAGSNLAQQLIKKIKCKRIICISRNLKRTNTKKIFFFNDFFSNQKQIKKLVKRKKITALFFNNFTIDNLILNKSNVEIKKELNENVINVFEYSKAIAEIMIENQFGRLIYFGSSRALSSDIGISGYSISKNALIGMMKSFSKEFSRYNITSNCISLGFFKSPLFSKIDEKIKKKMLSRCTIKNLGDIESINNAIYFVTNSKYLTGSTLFLDGGYE
tara:strand:- start:248 stop:922 length:675 start_codon:yes stop_codon:yes gene_type:complete